MTANAVQAVEEFRARVEAAATDMPYRVRRTEWGVELTVDVNAPQWRELLTRQRLRQVHTYRVALHPREKTFTITDVVRRVEYEAGPGGVRLGAAVSTGRSVYVIRSWSLDGTPQYSFSSAEGHRLIRRAARELGWRERKPLSMKIALGIGIVCGAIGLGMLIALAVAFWP
ncbi:hypothetical protein [Streptomyces sp. NPDC040750]|uniref:hypothetical protein n=1 Tax=Streptomyces sp. NPDC040750 TaxID=3154491 RepID=UPI0033EFB946